MFTEAELKKLPNWAKEKIHILETKLSIAEGEIDKFSKVQEKSNIWYNDMGGELRIYLPKYCWSVSFDKDGDKIDVHLVERNGKLRLEITPSWECNGTFVIQPVVSNVVWIDLVKE
jgi:hypothetical protein